MRKVSLLKLSIAAAAMMAVAASTTAVKADSVGATANAAIEKALTLTEDTQMNFGRVEAPTSGSGTVVLAPAGTTTDTGVTRLSGPTVAAGGFSITGSPSASYTVTAIADTTITDGTTTLNLTALGHNASGSLDSSGNGTFGVGGTLTIPSTATAGTYTGTYTVIVNY